jgi:hypothetical protein
MAHVAKGGNYDNAILRARILQVLEQGHRVTPWQLTALVNADYPRSVKSSAVIATLARLVRAGDVVKDTSSNGPIRYMVPTPALRNIVHGEATERVFAYAISIRLTMHNVLTGEETENRLTVDQARYYFEEDGLSMFELEPCKFAFLRWLNSRTHYERVTILTTAMCE